MKLLAGGAIAMLMTFAASAAEPVTFSGAIWENGGVRLSFEENVPAGQTRSMSLSGGQTVEMTVNAAGAAQVRLLDRAGSALHATSSERVAAGTLSFMYTRCKNGSFAYSSPAEPGKPACR